MKRTVRRRGDKEYTYLSLVEAVRSGGKNTQRELFRLGEVGELERTGQLDRIVAALSSYTNKHWIASDELEGAGAPSYGAVAAIACYFDRVGLRTHFAGLGEGRRHQHLADTVFVMVANRLLDPASKRHTILEWLSQVALPDGVSAPLLDQCYRALDVIAEQKEATEEVLYRRLTDLSNLDLRLALYDLTSTYFETSRGSSEDFSSRAYGYSRDKRGDRPQVVIGLLVTGNGIPIAHYVFPGNTRDSTTLQQVMTDYQARFGVGKIALVCDRGLISEQNLADVAAAGFDHVLATRLHHDGDVAAVLERAAAVGDDAWSAVPGFPGTKAFEVNHGGRRFVAVSSAERKAHDDRRREELLARTEQKLITLADRVRAGKLVDPAKIGAGSDRILRDSGVARCFAVTIRHGVFSWRFDEEALSYEEKLLAGRYVLTTSLQPEQASVTDIVRHYKMLQNVERRFPRDEGLPRSSSRPPPTRGACPRPHRPVRDRRGDRGGDGRRSRSRSAERPRPARTDDDTAPRPCRAREDPPAPPPRRTRHRARRPAGQTAAPDPRRVPRRGLDLGKSQTLLSSSYT